MPMNGWHGKQKGRGTKRKGISNGRMKKNARCCAAARDRIQDAMDEHEDGFIANDALRERARRTRASKLLGALTEDLIRDAAAGDRTCQRQEGSDKAIAANACGKQTRRQGWEVARRRARAKKRRRLPMDQLTVAANMMVAGTGSPLASAVVQTMRIAQGQEPTSERTVQRALNDLGQHHNRGAKKAGKTDPETPWAKARLALSNQLLAQLTRYKWNRLPKATKLLWPRLDLDQILFVDEKNMKCVLGNQTRIEWRFWVDKNDPSVLRERSHPDAVLPDWMPQTKGKFMKDCGGMFGVMMKRGEGRAWTGDKMTPLSYTGTKVVGPDAWKKAFLLEVQRPKLLASYKNVDGNARNGGWNVQHLPHGKENPYRARYGDGWEQKVTDAVNKSLTNVNTMIDHVVAEGNRLFAGTRHADDWVIYHDALGSWWTKAAQQRIEDRGMKDRQCRSLGPTNKGTRYFGKLVGNSPELMPLDNNLFADLMAAVRWNMACTFFLPEDDPRKFKRGTPAEAWKTLARSWEWFFADVRACLMYSNKR